MAKILVLDGHCSAALAFTRSLSRAGHLVAVGYNKGAFAPASLSRYRWRNFDYPVSTDQPANFVESVLRFVHEQAIDLVVPVTDWTIFPLVERRERFRGCASLAVPSVKALDVVSDKYSTIALARELGVPTPRTLLARSVEDLEVAREWTFPLVIKDRYSVRWLVDGVVFGSTAYAYSWEDLVQKVQRRLEQAGDILIQQFVKGEGIGFSCFTVGGKAFLPFQWRRVREENPCGGASSARRSVALDAQVFQFGSRLMNRSGFEGIGMVEFKRDRETGQLYLMEINGRPWGSLQLAVDSGIDYPRHLAAWHLDGSRPPKQLKYDEHITCRRLVGDLDHLSSLWKGKPSGWSGAYPSFWPSVVRVAVPWYPGLRYEDLYLRDPRPGLTELFRWFELRFRKIAARPQRTPRLVKGIVHCHTTLSYDGEFELTELCALLRQHGFGFVALTEHPRGLSAADYEDFVRKCKEVSGKDFVAIPGLEFRCKNGLEIAGLGISEWLDAQSPDQIVGQIRELGGFSVWVHPYRNGRWRGPLLECDAIEVMNLKEDGPVSPNLSLLRKVVRERKAGRHFYAIFGMDFHDSWQPFSAWVECQTSELTAGAILGALRDGQFVSRVPYATASSSGAIGIADYTLLLLIRSVFLVWRRILKSVPDSMRNSLIVLRTRVQGQRPSARRET